MVTEGVNEMHDFRIETFLAVCKAMNYTKAARRLHITQPAVSQHIHHLEHYYGCPLFSMQGKKLEITPAGLLLLEAAKTQVNDEKQLLERMHQPHRIPLSIGATLSATEGLLSQSFAYFLKKHANQKITMRTANTETLLTWMDEGEIDVAFVEGYFSKEIYDYIPYCEEDFIAVCSPDYPAWETFRRVEDLYCQPLLIREQGSGSRAILERYLESRNAGTSDFNHTIEIGSIHLIKEMCKQQIGITFIYEHVVKEELTQKKLVKLNIKDMPLQHDITYLWRKHSNYSETYRTLLDDFIVADSE